MVNLSEVEDEIQVINTEVANISEAVDTLAEDLLDLVDMVEQNSNDIAGVDESLGALSNSISDAVTQNSNDIAGVASNISELEESLELVSGRALSNALDIIGVNIYSQGLSNQIDIMREDIEALEQPSNLSLCNLNTVTLNVFEDHGLTIGGVNFLDALDSLRDEFTSNEYELPSNISVNELTANRLINDSYYPGIVEVGASLIPTSDEFFQLGDPAHRWLEGHFVAITASNLFGTHSDGSSRRVLLESDVDFTGYATEAWVASQGYLTTGPDLSSYATTSYVDSNINEAVSNIELTPGPKGDTGDIGPVGPVGPPGTTTWDGIEDKPNWTSKVNYAEIGEFMWPPQATNQDLLVSDSVTPLFDDSYNLGQHGKRYRNLFAIGLQTNAIRCERGSSIFVGTYDPSVTGDTFSFELRQSPSDSNLLDLHALGDARFYGKTMVVSDLRCLGPSGSATLSMGVSSYLPNLNNRIKNLAHGTGDLDACPKEQIRGWDTTTLNSATSYTDSEISLVTSYVDTEVAECLSSAKSYTTELDSWLSGYGNEALVAIGASTPSTSQVNVRLIAGVITGLSSPQPSALTITVVRFTDTNVPQEHQSRSCSAQSDAAGFVTWSSPTIQLTGTTSSDIFRCVVKCNIETREFPLGSLTIKGSDLTSTQTTFYAP